jgi:3-methyladenine DNA glycosylase AlkD
MSAQELALEVIARLRAFTNPIRQVATANYFPSAQQNLGVAATDMRSVVRDLKQRLKTREPAEVLAVALAIIEQNTLEGRQAAYELVAGHRAGRESLNAAKLRRLGRGIDNWASVDGFACCLAGVAWREGRIADAEVAKWAHSKNRWWRRAALASTVALNTPARGGHGDVKRTLAVCKLLVSDHDDMVAKAMSWALRALVRWDRSAVAAFIEKHKFWLSKRVIREVNNKLRTGTKSGKQSR